MQQSIIELLNKPYIVSNDDIQKFNNDGYIILRNIIHHDVIDYFKDEFRIKVKELNKLTKSMEERTTYEKAFLQVINLWEHSKKIKEFVLGKRLGSIATQLMNVNGVRLYHDQALYKEPSSGITPWHADQFYWPLDSNKCCTAWIPLQDTPENMGPLGFSPGSHKIDIGRSLKISDESEKYISNALKINNLDDIILPYFKGDVSFHLGWTFHHAGANKSSIPREVMTIIYMDESMKLINPKNDNQIEDRNVFCPGIEVGNIINSNKNLLIYSTTK